MTRNTELLEKTMQFILDHPEQHDQSAWCGTPQCFAGWAATLTGWAKVAGWDVYVRRGDREERVSVVAAEELGLTEREANVLFNGGNDVSELQMMVKDLLNGDTLRSAQEYWEAARRPS